MHILIACEFTGITREAFQRLGHTTWSCDYRPSEIPSRYHHQGDVRDLLTNDRWDIIIAHPPCRYLAYSGRRWWPKDGQPFPEQEEALAFARMIWNYPYCRRICLENPRSILSKSLARPRQRIQPYQFGHPVRKETWLWLRGLPRLQPTDIIDNRQPFTSFTDLYRSPADRSRSFPGIAEAMAQQWGLKHRRALG